MSAPHRSLSMIAMLALSACASAGTGTEAPPMGPGATPPPEAAPPERAEEEVATTGRYYTDAQADRGRDQFRSRCTECHDSREFHDTQFKFKWSRRDLGTLYELVSTTMPEDQPGSLPPQTYADILAYVLRLNELAAGSVELTPDPERLAAISLAPIRD